MKLLLDTHAFLWFVAGDAQLSPAARAAIEDTANQRLVSVASLWEMAIKSASGKLDLTGGLDAWLPGALTLCAADVLPIQACHALATRALPLHHKDPFDRLLIAQAQTEGLTLVSVDENMPRYGVALLW